MAPAVCRKDPEPGLASSFEPLALAWQQPRNHWIQDPEPEPASSFEPLALAWHRWQQARNHRQDLRGVRQPLFLAWEIRQAVVPYLYHPHPQCPAEADLPQQHRHRFRPALLALVALVAPLALVAVLALAAPLALVQVLAALVLLVMVAEDAAPDLCARLFQRRHRQPDLAGSPWPVVAEVVVSAAVAVVVVVAAAVVAVAALFALRSVGREDEDHYARGHRHR